MVVERGPSRTVKERKKRSCSECRRRKQKCDQRHPCRHCSRRMPQPICQYEGSPLLEQDAVGDLLEPSRFESAPISAAPTSATIIPLSPDPPAHWEVDPLSWAHATPPTPTSGNGNHWDVVGEEDPAFYTYHAGGLYINTFFPFPIANAARSHASLFMDACRASARTPMDGDAYIAARLSTIDASNNMPLPPSPWDGDETVEASVRLVMNDVCFGVTNDSRVYLDAVRENLRLRGRLFALGADGELAKMVLIVELATTAALETTPSYLDQEISDHGQAAVHESSPPRQAPTRPATHLDPSTAAMLKDVGFLLDTVLALPPEPLPWELQKVQFMSSWLHGRLSEAVAEKLTANTKHLHRSVRLASLIYCRAIQARQPFSLVVTEKDAAELADAVGKVPLDTWNGMLDTLVWVLGAVMPTARNVPHFCWTRMMMMAAAVQLGLTDWSSASGALARLVKLQAWLRGPRQE